MSRPDPAARFVHVVADDRERAAPVVAVLQSMNDVAVEVRRLRVGDYLVEDWLFERKALTDFAESIKDGRLFSQARRLLSTGRPVALILEGRAGDLAPSQMQRPALQGALISLTGDIRRLLELDGGAAVSAGNR
ncbi:MAG: hypothetical protein KGS61_20000 [Verrucomicrobia bacterium]|nr:hypothetical protein [Verrucomicrobiota bacterium]